MQNLDGLNNITHIGNSGNISYILIRGNPELTNLDGFESLTSVGTTDYPYQEVFGFSQFQIRRNEQLQNLDGLYNLTGIYGDFTSSTTNSSLTDYCGLQNLLANGFYDTINLGSSLSVQDIIDGNCME